VKIETTNLKDCYILNDSLFGDPRGYFFESFNQKDFLNQTGLEINFVQDNQSKSSKGVLRGLHFQIGDSEQSKLVRVIQGSVLDVAVDLRKNSPTFGKHITVELTGSNHKQLFIPRGFAHGFVVLSETAIFFYKCDNYYNPQRESGIIYNDSDLNIDWKLLDTDLILSEKDRKLDSFEAYCKSQII
jgi:dTDP-4-dehydrorhamnose 3,5-epimerase